MLEGRSRKSRGAMPKNHRAIKAETTPELNPEVKTAKWRMSDELQWAGQLSPNQEFWDPQTTSDSN